MTEVEVAGERLALLPERAVWWAAAGTLLVADVHLGKAAAFRAAGVPVPGGTTAEGVARLAGALARTRARRLVVLGDLLHARAGRSAAVLEALARWRAGWPGEVVLVRGNHDRGAGDPPAELGVRCVDAPVAEPPFVLAHEPGEAGGGGYELAGHLHPAVRLVGAGRQRERLPCFVFGARGAVLPAFGPFTGGADVRPRAGDRVFVVAEGEVVEVGRPAENR